MTDKNIDMAVKIASLVSQQGGTAYYVDLRSIGST